MGCRMESQTWRCRVWHSPPTFHVEHCPDRKRQRRQCFTWNIQEYKQGQALVFHVKPTPLDVPPVRRLELVPRRQP